MDLRQFVVKENARNSLLLKNNKPFYINKEIAKILEPKSRAEINVFFLDKTEVYFNKLKDIVETDSDQSEVMKFLDNLCGQLVIDYKSLREFVLVGEIPPTDDISFAEYFIGGLLKGTAQEVPPRFSHNGMKPEYIVIAADTAVLIEQLVTMIEKLMNTLLGEETETGLGESKTAIDDVPEMVLAPEILTPIEQIELVEVSHKVVLLFELGIIDLLKKNHNLGSKDLSHLLGSLTGIKPSTLIKYIDNYKTNNPKSDVYTRRGVKAVNQLLTAVNIKSLDIPR